MKMTKWISMCTVALVLFASAAQANTNVLPEDQWNDEVALWLARAMVSEADWSTQDHAAIAWVLKRRWEARIKTNPSLTFLEQIQQYCSGMRGNVRTTRHVWIRSLTLDGSEPEGWPSDAKWSNYRPAWEKALRFAHAWSKGLIKDPCPRADHWGGTMDHPEKSWKPVNCGPTRNIFYTVR